MESTAQKYEDGNEFLFREALSKKEPLIPLPNSDITTKLNNTLQIREERGNAPHPARPQPSD